jgi:hypothetical protein
MTIVELANDYQKKGWFTNMTSEEIKNEILNLESEILRVDKRTYNGKMTRTFNKCKIEIAKVILEAQKELSMN